MRHFTSTQDWTVGELQALLDQAAGLRSDPVRPLLQGRTLALLFLNRSLRTRASFQIGAAQLGATAIGGVLAAAVGPWGATFIGIGVIVSVLGAYLAPSVVMMPGYVNIGAYVGEDQEDHLFTIRQPIYSGPAYRAGLHTDDKVVRSCSALAALLPAEKMSRLAMARVADVGEFTDAIAYWTPLIRMGSPACDPRKFWPEANETDVPEVLMPPGALEAAGARVDDSVDGSHREAEMGQLVLDEFVARARDHVELAALTSDNAAVPVVAQGIGLGDPKRRLTQRRPERSPLPRNL